MIPKTVIVPHTVMATPAITASTTTFNPPNIQLHLGHHPARP